MTAMFYAKLQDGVKLRGYIKAPRVYYTKESGRAQALSEEQLDFLKRCDGVTPIEDNLDSGLMLAAMSERGLAEECARGGGVTPWQRYRYCDNRCFPLAKIAVTGRCLFNCRHCFNAAGNNRSNGEFTQDELFALLAELDACGVHALELTGGEPMMHPNFEEFIEEAVRRGMKISELLTTAHFVTEEFLRRLQTLGQSPLFKVSFDGAGHHDWFRNADGAEARLMEKLKLLIRFGFRVQIHMVLHRGNLDKVVPTALLVDSLGVERIEVLRLCETPRVEQNGLLENCMPPNEIYDFGLEVFRQYAAQAKQTSLYMWQFGEYHPDTGDLVNRGEHSGEYRDSLHPCGLVRERFCIDADGSFWPCLSMSGWFKSRGVSFGSMKEMKINEAMRGGKLLETQLETIGDLRKTNKECDACAFVERCLGGCPSFRGLFHNGDLHGCDRAKCLLFKQYLGKFEALRDELKLKKEGVG